MEIKTTEIKDCFWIKPKVFKDDRGYFKECFNAKDFQDKTGLKVDFVQDNLSKSSFGVLRGLHIQKGIYAQAKLVQVLEGEVLDVVVDARPNSPTFGNIVSKRLSAENHEQLFVPKGCLHGFAVWSETCLFSYKVDEYYHKEAESGVFFKDEKLNIDWGLETKDVIISPKDKELETFNHFINSL